MLDYGRFLTPDIAELQVAKGYASVPDGPVGPYDRTVSVERLSPTRFAGPSSRQVTETQNVTLCTHCQISWSFVSLFITCGTVQD